MLFPPVSSVGIQVPSFGQLSAEKAVSFLKREAAHFLIGFFFFFFESLLCRHEWAFVMVAHV